MLPESLASSRGGRSWSNLVAHPGADPAYASYVLQGLALVFGEGAIRFSTEGFPRSLPTGRVLAFYPEEQPTDRCFLAFHDNPSIDAGARDWASLYGMVNLHPRDAAPDLMALGPTFAIRVQPQQRQHRGVQILDVEAVRNRLGA